MDLMEPPKKDVGRPKGEPTVTIHTKISVRLGKQLRAYMDSKPDGAMLRRVTERAYALLLESEGFWPPPDETPLPRKPKKNGH